MPPKATRLVIDELSNANNIGLKAAAMHAAANVNPPETVLPLVLNILKEIKRVGNKDTRAVDIHNIDRSFFGENERLSSLALEAIQTAGKIGPKAESALDELRRISNDVALKRSGSMHYPLLTDEAAKSIGLIVKTK
jgi:hypothetical protein